MAISDVASGLLLVVFGLLSLAPRRIWSRWAASAVGLWLVFAPLLLWAPTAAAYATDTIVGALVLALIALSLPRGPIRERYGTASRWIR
jgi:hypothetical protein